MSESKFRGGHSSGNNAGTRRRASLAKQVSGRSLSEVVEKLGRNRIKDFAASSKLPIPIFLNKN